MFTNKMATLLPDMLLCNLHCGMVVSFSPSLVLSFYAFSHLLGILSTFCLLAFRFPISLSLTGWPLWALSGSVYGNF